LSGEGGKRGDLQEGEIIRRKNLWEEKGPLSIGLSEKNRVTVLSEE